MANQHALAIGDRRIEPMPFKHPVRILFLPIAMWIAATSGACRPIQSFLFVEAIPTPAPLPAMDKVNTLPAPTVMIAAPTQTPVTVDNTPTALPPTIRTWGDYPGPSVWPPIEIPAPLGVLPKPVDQINVLLLGDDQRPYEHGYRTDAILLLTINPSHGTVSLTSFPRDLYVYAPGWTMQRINVIFERGGFDLMAETFEYNFGVKPDYYIKVNIWQFQAMLDDIGGIDVQVAYSMSDIDPHDASNYRTVPAGKVHMDGDMALWYSRARSASSDFDRARRHQEVLQAVFMRLMSVDVIQKAPQFYSKYRNSVSTNLTLENVAQLFPFARTFLANFQLRQYLIGRQFVTDWTVPTDGSKVLLPKRAELLLVMQQILSP